MYTNLYDILGVSKDATFEEIKAKYKSLAQQHHPDKGGDPEVFKRIKNAYEILSDPTNRKRYDTTGQFETKSSIRDSALEQLSRIFFNLIPNINPETDDPILIMKNESRQEKENINNHINGCNNRMDKLKKIINKIKRKNDGENLLKMFAENQLKAHENELQNYIHQIQIVDAVVKILEEYQYGDIIILIENDINTSSQDQK